MSRPMPLEAPVIKTVRSRKYPAPNIFDQSICSAVAIHRSEEAVFHFLSFGRRKEGGLGRHLVAQPFQIVAYNQQVTWPAVTIRHPVRSSASTLEPSSRIQKVVGQITFV